MTASAKRAIMGLLLMGAAPATGQGPLHVDITQGIASPLLIAIPDVASGPIPDAPGTEDTGIALSQIVRADLLSTGLYRPVRVEGRLSAEQEVAFAPFAKAGAQALVVGRARSAGSGLLAYDCTLYDVFGARAETSQRIVVSTAQWRRAAHKCADMVFAFTTGDPGHFDTRLLFVAEEGQPPEQHARLVSTDYDGANATELTQGRELVAMPRFARDGHRVVFLSYADPQPKLVLADLGSGQVTPLTLPKGVPSSARFSPDGGTIVFSLARDGDADIYAIDLASGSLRQLTDTAGADTSPSFAPDGKSIVFESDRSGEQQLYVMAADGSGQKRISFGDGGYASPVWNPRDDLIAFTHVEGGRLRIGVMKPDGSRQRIISDGSHDEDPSWAISGRAMAFQRTEGGASLPAIWITDLTGKAQHQVKTEGPASDPSWSGTRP
jgi:TolB protein